MKAEEIINTIWVMQQAYPGDWATHVLLHPQLERELYTWHERHAYLMETPINREDRTIFGLSIITVHNKPYPYMGLAKVVSNEQPAG